MAIFLEVGGSEAFDDGGDAHAAADTHSLSEPRKKMATYS
jgi:hypothetical protein